MRPSRFFIEDVRCFAGLHEFPIRPLTFLVGENSTGKSTVLGCMQALADYVTSGFRYPPLGINFNREPWQMGSFRDIVRKSRPLKQHFRIGLGFDLPAGGRFDYTVEVRKKPDSPDPFVAAADFSFPDGRIRIVRSVAPDERSDSDPSRRISVAESAPRHFRVDIPEGRYPPLTPWHLSFSLRRRKSGTRAEERFRQYLKQKEFPRPFGRAAPGSWISMAPIRAKPKRTCDALAQDADAEGSDMPMALARLSGSNRGRWKKLKERLELFGSDSGLFANIAVRRMSRRAGDPFQLQIKTHGPKSNLVDTGYGVSQALPLLVRILMNGKQGRTFLLQQPEVHLHPRAQAALTSFLIRLTRRSSGPHSLQSNGFIVETHSDYMVDRARIEIQRERLAPDDVALIFLEPKPRSGVAATAISFDSMGNMTDVPQTFRSWFVAENFDLLGIVDS